MQNASAASRLRQIAAELRMLPDVLGEPYGYLEVMRRGAELVREAFGAGAFRAGSPLAELGIEIRHYVRLRNDRENIAVREGQKPEWRPHVWFAAVRLSSGGAINHCGDEEICTAVGPVADAMDREAEILAGKTRGTTAEDKLQEAREHPPSNSQSAEKPPKAAGANGTAESQAPGEWSEVRSRREWASKWRISKEKLDDMKNPGRPGFCLRFKKVARKFAFNLDDIRRAGLQP